jgi:hypothetical protein
MLFITIGITDIRTISIACKPHDLAHHSASRNADRVHGDTHRSFNGEIATQGDVERRVLVWRGRGQYATARRKSHSDLHSFHSVEVFNLPPAHELRCVALGDRFRP